VIRGAGFDELDARTLYRILRLRAEVFVVEQDCPYLDPDGRDAEPGTLHLWVDPDPGAPTVAAALRVVVEPDGSRRIGRVVTAPDHRRAGVHPGGRGVPRGRHRPRADAPPTVSEPTPERRRAGGAERTHGVRL